VPCMPTICLPTTRLASAFAIAKTAQFHAAAINVATQAKFAFQVDARAVLQEKFAAFQARKAVVQREAVPPKSGDAIFPVQQAVLLVVIVAVILDSPAIKAVDSRSA
jgi:hypothetical protein